MANRGLSRDLLQLWAESQAANKSQEFEQRHQSAHKACLEDFTAAYLRLPRLFQNLTVAKEDGHYTRFMQQLAKLDVLILDDWGLSPFRVIH